MLLLPLPWISAPLEDANSDHVLPITRRQWPEQHAKINLLFILPGKLLRADLNFFNPSVPMRRGNRGGRAAA